MSVPKFQIIELKYPHPETGARFWIEWEVPVEKEREIEEEQEVKKTISDKSFRSLFGLFKIEHVVTEIQKVKRIEKYIEMEWETFYDATKGNENTNTGYRTIQEAGLVIDRYRINRKPIIHKYDI